ncbi:MAG: Lrp/AsnC family transcriptional regulator [Thaumarchaeota archaeon]|jgi:DNA-binding Lrp family transcriptional regulator|nr:Lrp/AsnC family transcriptional regulator [Nitrososphaerota archaeon]MBT3743111.1 Lrp/AsnC family transcriptional regulator [Nitrososphaerota archaeon]MBT3743538.1 Lrp/AsnC family transcriptional regulator [Nitrososphaerota archaeon]MBT4057636.1 Lrp/AsnC family transcriptional regulator [Nitrososphaerota archaeon]MBT4176011.1 Lrp/AsnC family transcriptional regulator [Nitrososphaerota archaeon]|tara:strand:+ start:1220 stop:1462 length:243 start_codon:yes stop_codon:yes gene_type:complete
MSKAFILINCELGSEEQIISELKTFSDIKKVQGTFGAYDIIAEISSESIEKIRETITGKIRKIGKIRSTLTLTKIEGQGL